MKLSELKKGEQGRVEFVRDYPLKRRLLDMGITKGVVITMKKEAPLGDPVCIQLRGYDLCIRRKDLFNIEVVKL